MRLAVRRARAVPFEVAVRPRLQRRSGSLSARARGAAFRTRSAYPSPALRAPRDIFPS